jgi:hypothetical protein
VTGRRRRAALGLVCGLAAATLGAALEGCAKRGPPSGGPPDVEPPRLIASSPDSGTAGAPRTGSISLTFSEGMDPRGTAEAVSLAPIVEIRQRRWGGRTLTLVPAETLEADQTYTVFLGSGARDRHGNPLEGRATVVFSTADSLPPGVLEGRVEARGFPASGTYLWCYRDSAGRQPDSTARDFDAIGLADPDGRFRVVGLPVPASYRLWVFADLNNNRSFEPATDILAPVDTVFALTAGQPGARGFGVTVVNPRSPGHVRGAVLDSLGISRGALTVMAISATDSLKRTLTGVDNDAKFDLSLTAGTWRIRAWRDLDRDRSWQRETEPASPARELAVEAAAEIVDITLVLQRPPVRP